MIEGAATDVILRDGSTLRLRAPLPDDADAMLEFFESLSERSRYLRFHGFPALGPKLVAPFLDPDWEERGALAGWLEGRMVALANFVRLRDPRRAEVAFTVADDYQGRGIGTRLLEQLAVLAADAGVEQFVAEVMPDNRNMLVVFRDAGFDVTRELDGGSVEVHFPIAPTERYRDQVAERNHVAVRASLQPFFEPACVAVIGASARRGSIGGELFRNVLSADFAGAAYPVNRGGDPVAGVHGYKRVADIPDTVDLVVICLPGEHVLDAAQEALEAGVKALVVISAGFAEIGAEGRVRQERLLELVRAHGARMIGPNCLGISSATTRLNATFAPRAFPAGKIGFSSQSGALGLAVLEHGEERDLGLSAFVSIGNKADVSSNDLLEWWAEDANTELVMLYLESFGNPRAFARIARRVARKKPVLAMKSGTTRAGSKAASSHTAALAGSEAAVDALFRQAGVIRTQTLDELVDVAALLSDQPVPRGRRVALLTNAGGLGILCADACEAAGLELPSLSEETLRALHDVMPVEGSAANPVDILGSANAKTFATVLPLVLADPGRRLGHRSLRPDGRRLRGRRRRGHQPLGGKRGRQDRALRVPVGEGRARDVARRRSRSRLLVPRGSGSRTRTRGRPWRLAAAPRRHRPRARSRSRRGRGGRRGGARARRRRLARARAGKAAARGVRAPCRARARRGDRRRRDRSGDRARLSRWS